MGAFSKKLEFLIGVKDGASTKIGKIQQAMEKMAKHTEVGFKQAASGVVTAWAGAKSSLAMLDPGRELNRSLNELAALDIGAGPLSKIQEQAQNAAAQYGLAANDIVASAYDIKRGLAGVKDSDLGGIATSSSVLAKAVKSDSQAVTGYMAALRKSYAAEAAKMGDAAWVENLSGQTAAAIQEFGDSSLEKYRQAFAALGKQKVAMPEQMAVLGVAMQSGMDGGAAGAAYKKMLGNMDNIGLRLGVSVRGADGELLAMDKILGNIQKKHQGILNQGDLKKAFGEDTGQLLYSLQKNQANLVKGMEAIGKNNGLGKAAQMAAKLADPLDKAGAAAQNVRASLGQKLMPVIGKAADVAAGFLNAVNGWINRFPNLTKWIGLTAIALFSLVSVMGTLLTVVGLSKLAMAGMALSGKTLFGVFGTLGKAAKALTIIQGLLNTAFMACPLVWLIGLIAGLVAIIYWLAGSWQGVVDAFLDTAWGKALMIVIEGIGAALEWLGDIIPAIGRALYDHFMGRIKAIAGGIMWILEKLGIIDSAEAGGINVTENRPEPPPPPRQLAAASVDRTPEGGLNRSISNSVSNAGSRDTINNVGEVHNHFEQKVSRDEVEEMVLMGA